MIEMHSALAPDVSLLELVAADAERREAHMQDTWRSLQSYKSTWLSANIPRRECRGEPCITYNYSLHVEMRLLSAVVMMKPPTVWLTASDLQSTWYK